MWRTLFKSKGYFLCTYCLRYIVLSIYAMGCLISTSFQFQKRKYAKLKQFPCGKKGNGLQLLENVSEGTFLIEYVGEVKRQLFLIFIFFCDFKQ